MQTSNDQADLLKHKRYIEVIAEESGLAPETIEPIYTDVIDDLKEAASVADFIPIFAWRRTKALLSQR